MILTARMAGMALVMSVAAASAQVVTFSDPGEWMTQRSAAISAKVQLDTARIASKKLTMTMYKVVNGRRQRLGAPKTFAVTDFSEEFRLGNAGASLIGGFDYLGIEWSIPGATDKGVCEPFGVVVINNWPAGDKVNVRTIDDGLSAGQILGALTDGDWRTVGGGTYALAWNADALWIACKGAAIELAFDGKNAKNAFLSYPDRLVRMMPEHDSVYAYHCRRAFSNGTISYPQGNWHHESVVHAANGVVLAGVRWYDTGIIPQNERTVGFAAFAVQADGKVRAAAPRGAVRENPGTWGDLRLVK